MAAKDETTSLRIPNDALRVLRETAEREGRTVQETIRRASFFYANREAMFGAPAQK